LPLWLAVPMAVAARLALLVAFPPYGWWPAGPGQGGAAGRGDPRRRLPPLNAGLGFLTGVALFAPLLEWTNLHTGYLPWALLSLLQAGYLCAAGCRRRVHLAAGGPGALVVAGGDRAAVGGAGGAAGSHPVRWVPVGAVGVQPG
jgi:hypothetical protein